MARGIGWLALLALVVTAAQADLRADATAALDKAITWYHSHACVRGGYVYYTSLDLTERWGEGRAAAQTIFVQPPGTPTVGEAFLDAYQATGEAAYLTAAEEAGLALVDGQLVSGGWTQTVDFGPSQRPAKYRRRPAGNWNQSSLDDDQSQAALRFLMRLDRALAGREPAIAEAVDYGLTALLAAQYPCGAFPQVFSGPASARPVAPKASFPEYDWRTEGRIKAYWDEYTLNDGVAGNVARTLLAARQRRPDAKVDAALRKLGDWLLLAQMPAPQPAWCQQYNASMQPIWARSFEPPAISSLESMDVMETLIALSRELDEPRYLSPIPAALTYLSGSLLPDGRLARYYELRTNRPLYMDDKDQLTYDASLAPAHYGWQQPSRLGSIEQDLREAQAGRAPTGPPAVTEATVRRLVDALDGQGRWISVYQGEPLVGQPKFATGFRYLSSAVFAAHVTTLSRWLTETRPRAAARQPSVAP